MERPKYKAGRKYIRKVRKKQNIFVAEKIFGILGKKDMMATSIAARQKRFEINVEKERGAHPRRARKNTFYKAVSIL